MDDLSNETLSRRLVDLTDEEFVGYLRFAFRMTAAASGEVSRRIGAKPKEATVLLYRAQVYGKDGDCWVDSGHSVTVDGVDYVQLTGGTLTPRSQDWHATEAAALMAAAETVQRIADTIAARAARMREGKR